MTIRRATIRTESEHARIIADALRPDNTDEMETVVDTESTSGNGSESDSTTIETVIERETTGGLRTTADDYVTNLMVAAQFTNNTDTNYE
jgi:rubrerythrin